MKRLFGFLAFTAFSVVSANAASTATVQFIGQPTETILLDSVKTRTEYVERDVVRTCYRQVFRGYVWDCPGRGRYPGPGYPGPGPGPGYPRPRPYPGPRGPYPGCRQIPVYDTVPYSCVQRERIPVEVFDANVTAKLEMEFGAMPAGMAANETFVATLNGDNLTVTAKGSGQVLISESAYTQSASRSGDTIAITAAGKYMFREAAPIVAGFNQGIMNLSVLNGRVMMDMNTYVTSVASAIKVKVIRKRAMADDVLLTNRLVPFTAFDMKSAGGATNVAAAYSTLGIPALSKGKYEFTFTIDAETMHGERLMNAMDFGNALKATSVMNLKVSR